MTVPNHICPDSQSVESDRLNPGMVDNWTRPPTVQVPLRDLARRSPEERHCVLRDAAVAADTNETDAWDAIPVENSIRRRTNTL